MSSPHSVGDFFANCFLGSVQGYPHIGDWYTKTYYQKDGVGDPKRLDLSLLLASFDGMKPLIGEVSARTGYSFSPRHRAACIGTTVHANALLSMLVKTRLEPPTVEEVLLVSAYCLMITAEAFMGIGEPFDFVCITADGAEEFSSEDRPELLELSRALLDDWKEMFKIRSGGSSNSQVPDPLA